MLIEYTPKKLIVLTQCKIVELFFSQEDCKSIWKLQVCPYLENFRLPLIHIAHARETGSFRGSVLEL